MESGGASLSGGEAVAERARRVQHLDARAMVEEGESMPIGELLIGVLVDVETVFFRVEAQVGLVSIERAPRRDSHKIGDSFTCTLLFQVSNKLHTTHV
jgi:hypothetical protein